MPARLRARPEWRFFEELPKASRPLATAWYLLLLLRGALPAVFAVAMGVLVRAVERGDDLAGPLTFVGVVFVALQVLSPLHAEVGMKLGGVLSNHLNERLLRTTTTPPGHGPPRAAHPRQRVVEHGSHDDLMRAGGHYAELYGVQAAAYR